MRPLRLHWKEIAGRLGASRKVLLFFDLDGTLAPIAERPAQVRLRAKIRTQLERLTSKPGYVVGLLSGRSLEQLRRIVRVRGLIYIGNHGFQIEGPLWSFRHPAFRQVRQKLLPPAHKLQQLLSDVRGVLVENKGPTLSVHYRQVHSPSAAARVRRFVRNIFHERNGSLRWDITDGKKVIDVRPHLHWDKGSALRWIRKRVGPGSVIFFIGDDRTDEDAFRVLRGTGIPVCVGRSRRSQARYFLRRQADIDWLLSRLDELQTRS